MHTLLDDAAALNVDHTAPLRRPVFRPSVDADDDYPRRRLVRRIAQATGTFEHLLTGRVPNCVTVISNGDWLVVSLHEALSNVERRLAATADGLARVRDFHRYIFDRSLDSLREHVRHSTGVEINGALAHVDPDTGSVLKTFTTDPAVELFLLGPGLPTLGVPVDAHLHAQGASGNGAVRD